MTQNELARKAGQYLEKLCVEIDNRRTGSAGNRMATEFFAEVVQSFGFDTEMPRFDCLDWWHEGAELRAGDVAYAVCPSPYTLGCQVSGPLVVVRSLSELMDTDLNNKILLMLGEITAKQLMPKNFPFYNPDHHQQIYQILEAKQPQAIITATGRDLNMVGSQYPFPLFEDGDFNIPSVYMKDIEGEGLAALAGQDICLDIKAQRIPTVGCNVIARKGQSFPRRAVLLAHIDAKMNTPGALDNAAGVIVLLLLAELLAEYAGDLGIEMVAVNGEDYFSSPGERQYLELTAGTFSDIILGINIDGVGYREGKTVYSLYECPDVLSELIPVVFAGYDNMAVGEHWYAGDHGLFLINKVPALALTSEKMTLLMSDVVHTEKDTPAILRPALLFETAEALNDLLLQLADKKVTT